MLSTSIFNIQADETLAENVRELQVIEAELEELEVDCIDIRYVLIKLNLVIIW